MNRDKWQKKTRSGGEAMSPERWKSWDLGPPLPDSEEPWT